MKVLAQQQEPLWNPLSAIHYQAAIRIRCEGDFKRTVGRGVIVKIEREP